MHLTKLSSERQAAVAEVVDVQVGQLVREVSGGAGSAPVALDVPGAEQVSVDAREDPGSWKHRASSLDVGFGGADRGLGQVDGPDAVGFGRSKDWLVVDVLLLPLDVDAPLAGLAVDLDVAVLQT